MAFSSHHGRWEAPTFHFNSPNQSEDWSVFYTRALDYLDALDIELETDDQSCKGWKQIKLMFEGEDRKGPPEPYRQWCRDCRAYAQSPRLH